MASKLGKILPSYIDERYESQEWRRFVRDHLGLGYIQQRAVAQPVKKFEAYQYNGDFYGYLRFIGADPSADWIHLMINHLDHPSDWNEEFDMIYTLPNGMANELYLSFQSNQSNA